MTEDILFLLNRVIARQCMEDTNVLGHQIKEGMIVQANVWELHYDKEIWGQDPTTFEPERYEECFFV